MATTRTRPSRGRRIQPALEAVRWLWAGTLSLAFFLAGLALVFSGATFAVVGVQQGLGRDRAADVVVAAMFAVLGLAGVVAGVKLAFWLRPKLVLKLSGRKPPSLGGADGYSGGPSGGCGGDGGGGGGPPCQPGVRHPPPRNY